jgi:hypothetical protein
MKMSKRENEEDEGEENISIEDPYDPNAEWNPTGYG